jgi:hypothetical protein
MLELNSSEQRCLLEFVTGDFKFYCLLLGKKVYFVDFSFIFSEIKFCTLLMNWLVRKKMLTYLCNKFRPVSFMHYVKCGVNSLVAAEGLWHLGSVFYHETQHSQLG